jgi:hypothetical protein
MTRKAVKTYGPTLFELLNAGAVNPEVMKAIVERVRELSKTPSTSTLRDFQATGY